MRIEYSALALLRADSTNWKWYCNCLQDGSVMCYSTSKIQTRYLGLDAQGTFRLHIQSRQSPRSGLSSMNLFGNLCV
jgi:hypothetical protein